MNSRAENALRVSLKSACFPMIMNCATDISIVYAHVFKTRVSLIKNKYETAVSFVIFSYWILGLDEIWHVRSPISTLFHVISNGFVYRVLSCFYGRRFQSGQRATFDILLGKVLMQDRTRTCKYRGKYQVE
jgi:hypothetical protein